MQEAAILLADLQIYLRILMGLSISGIIINVIRINPRFSGRKYSNGVTIIKDKETGAEFMQYGSSSTLIEVKKGQKPENN